MDESQLTETLDRRGLLSDTHGAGCYALRLDVPDDLEAAWDAEFDARPQNFARLTDAERLLYVGAAANVYDRLCDHANAQVRRAAIMRVCPPEHVVDVTPLTNPFDQEYAYALSWTDASIAVYVDGEIL